MKIKASISMAWLLAATLSASAATPRQLETVRALEALAGSTQPFLEADLRIKDGAVRPGEPLETQLRSSRAAYITFVMVDAHGVAEVRAPDLGGTGNLLAPDTKVFYPAEESQSTFAARLPAGAAHLFILATTKPIGPIRGIEVNPGAEPIVLSAEQAPALLAKLRAELASSTAGEYQLASFPYTVKLGGAMQSYSVEEIVKYFAETTRNAEKPSLEGWGVNFAFNSADVLSTSQTELDKWGRVLRDPLLKSQVFVIAGHTDDVGTDDYNNWLSMQRAVSVRQALIAKYGIGADRLIAKGYGKAQPLVQRTDTEGRAMNRRVDFVRESSFSR